MRTSFIALVAAAALLPAGAQATTLIYGDFTSTAGLQLNGSTAAANDGARNVLRLTPRAQSQSGSAFSTSPITLADNYSFSTRFTFNINSPFFGGADGLVFVVQTNNNSVGGAGGGIGYAGIANSLGIEFDTWDNTGDGVNDGYSANHIGINTGGDINSKVLIGSPFFLDGGQDLTAWIDYNSTTDLLEVRLNNVNLRPATANLTYVVDLVGELGGGVSGTAAFVGFTSGTGFAGANHDIVNWEFRDTFQPIGGAGGAVPEPATWAMLILGFGLVGGALRRRVATGALAFA